MWLWASMTLPLTFSTDATTVPPRRLLSDAFESDSRPFWWWGHSGGRRRGQAVAPTPAAPETNDPRQRDRPVTLQRRWVAEHVVGHCSRAIGSAERTAPGLAGAKPEPVLPNCG